MGNGIRFKNSRCAGILPRQSDQILHIKFLVKREVLQHIQWPETVLLQHRSNGDRSEEMEEIRVYETDREMDGDTENRSDL